MTKNDELEKNVTELREWKRKTEEESRIKERSDRIVRQKCSAVTAIFMCALTAIGAFMSEHFAVIRAMIRAGFDAMSGDGR